MSHNWAAKLEHKKALSTEDARFIFEQTEKFLIDVNESHKSVVERTYTLLAVFVTVLTALIGFNVERQSVDHVWTEPLSLSIWITIIYMILGATFLSQNIRPTNYMGVGSPPMNLFNDSFFAGNVPEK
jgi:membrane protein required for beta-lactamase induction